MNKVILTGRLCHEPELRYIGQNNTATTKFTLAVNREYRNSQGEYDVDFIDCELWEKPAEVFCKYMTKGKLVGIEGKIRLDKYVSASGENVKKLKVRCNNFDFLTPKSKSTNDNIINSDDVFHTEKDFDCEISESEIPF